MLMLMMKLMELFPVGTQRPELQSDEKIVAVSNVCLAVPLGLPTCQQWPIKQQTLRPSHFSKVKGHVLCTAALHPLALPSAAHLFIRCHQSSIAFDYSNWHGVFKCKFLFMKLWLFSL